MSTVHVEFKALEHGSDLPVPAYATEHSAGVDLYAAVDADITLAKGERTLVPCGFSMALPQGFEAQIRPRSGLAFKHGLTVLNTPGTIDADYRGEIKVLLVNLGQEAYTVERGTRIAQMIIAPYTQAAFAVVENLDATQRGEGGFGSTGTTG